MSAEYGHLFLVSSPEQDEFVTAIHESLVAADSLYSHSRLQPAQLPLPPASVRYLREAMAHPPGSYEYEQGVMIHMAVAIGSTAAERAAVVVVNPLPAADTAGRTDPRRTIGELQLNPILAARQAGTPTYFVRPLSEHPTFRHLSEPTGFGKIVSLDFPLDQPMVPVTAVEFVLENVEQIGLLPAGFSRRRP